MNCTPKVGHLQFKKVQFSYDQIYTGADFKYRAVLHYHQVHSQQRTADHLNFSRTHLCRWIAAYRQGGIAAVLSWNKKKVGRIMGLLGLKAKVRSKRTYRPQAETFAKPPDVDAVQGVAAQRVQTYHIDRQTSEQRTTQKCAADGGFAKVSGHRRGCGKHSQS